MNSDGRACCPHSKGHTRTSQRKKDFGRGNPEKGSYASRLPRAYLQRRSLRDMEHNALIRRSPFPTVRSATKGKSRSATIGGISSTIYTRLEPSQVVPSAVPAQFVRNLVGAPLNHYSGRTSPFASCSLLSPHLCPPSSLSSSSSSSWSWPQ